MIINEQQAVNLVNADIRKSYQDPAYRVYKVTSYDWGWSMGWMPADHNKILYGSSDYLIHKNGFLSTWGQIAWDARIHPIESGDGIIHAFIKRAEATDEARRY